MNRFIRLIVLVAAATTFGCPAQAEVISDPCQTCPLTYADSQQELIDAGASVCNPIGGDRIWLVSSRHLSHNARCANLEDPTFTVYRLNSCGRRQKESLPLLESQLTPDRPLVIYVHGNLIDRNNAIVRGMFVYRSIKRRRNQQPVDWLIWSWPSSKVGIRWMTDFRKKALRTDSQGLYLAWFLRRQLETEVPITMIGYSFGARVITGSLHALAGGALGGRRMEGPEVTGAAIAAGLIAPALDSTWMSPRGYHGRATKNLDNLLVLYSRRDAVLKRYWLLDRIRSHVALGHTGPRSFGPRADGSKLPVRSKDCAGTIGFHHKEIDYYQLRQCNAGAEMARLIHAQLATEGI